MSSKARKTTTGHRFPSVPSGHSPQKSGGRPPSWNPHSPAPAAGDSKHHRFTASSSRDRAKLLRLRCRPTDCPGAAAPQMHQLLDHRRQDNGSSMASHTGHAASARGRRKPSPLGTAGVPARPSAGGATSTTTYLGAEAAALLACVTATLLVLPLLLPPLPPPPPLFLLVPVAIFATLLLLVLVPSDARAAVTIATRTTTSRSSSPSSSSHYL